jgi:hypothetical protein
MLQMGTTNVSHIKTICYWYLSIDMNCVPLHVKFEDGPSISTSRNGATTDKKLKLEIEKILKSYGIANSDGMNNSVRYGLQRSGQGC